MAMPQDFTDTQKNANAMILGQDSQASNSTFSHNQSVGVQHNYYYGATPTGSSRTATDLVESNLPSNPESLSEKMRKESLKRTSKSLLKKRLLMNMQHIIACGILNLNSLSIAKKRALIQSINLKRLIAAAAVVVIT